MKKTKTKLTVIVGIIIFFILTSLLIYYMYQRNLAINSKETSLEKIIPTQENNDKTNADGSVNSPYKSTNGDIKISVTSVNSDAQNYYFTVNLENVKTGKCILEVKQGNSSISIEGEVQLVTSYYTCTNMKIERIKLKPGKIYTRLTIVSDMTTTGAGEVFNVD